MPPQRPIPPNQTINQRANISFPTPVISDQIIEELISSEIGKYTPLQYGVLWDEVEHTAFQVKKPGFKLVWQGPVDTNSYLYKRIWANDRVDQDSYNAESISFLGENPAFPDITRVYVFPRDRWNTGEPDQLGPLKPLTPDSVYPDALLTSESEVPGIQPPELTSKYIKVVRRFQVIPGPITPSQDFDSELNIMVQTDRQLVLSDDLFQPEYFPLTLEVRETPQSKYVKLRIRSYLQELPATYTQYRTGSFPFPNILNSLTLTKATIAPTPNPFDTGSPPAALPRAEVIIDSPIRPGPTTPALFQIITSFAVSTPSPSVIYAINPNDVVTRRISFQLGIQSVLNDAISQSVSFSNDGRYGNLEESYSIGASTPSKTQYLADIGTYQTIGSDITRWRGSIWVKRDSLVLLL